MRRLSEVTALLLGACAAAADTGTENGHDAKTAPAPAIDAGDGGDRPGSDAGSAPLDAGPLPRPRDDVLVYAHSADELFSLDPTALTVTRIGAFRTSTGDAD